MARRVLKGRRYIPESQAEYIEKVNIEEKTIETRHGETKYFCIESDNRTEKSPLIITAHGGGFCRAHNKADKAFASMLVFETGSFVFDVDYKLSPEYAFPISYEEIYDVAKWDYNNADELGIDKSKIILCGNSSGGNLIAAALESAKTKEFPIRLQIIDYAPMDLYTDPSEKPEAYKSYVPFDQARAYNSLYISHEEAKNPYVSMVYATREMLEGLPEALIITAEQDSLHNETEKYAFMMMEAGVKVTMKKFINSNHGFVVFCMSDKYKEAHNLIINTIKNI